METIKCKIGEKEYEVHEILAVDCDSLPAIENQVDKMRQLHLKCSNISEEEYNQLTLSQRNILTQIINKVNHWGKEETDKEVLENEGKKKF